MALPTAQQLVNAYVAGGGKPLTVAQITGTAPLPTAAAPAAAAPVSAAPAAPAGAAAPAASAPVATGALAPLTTAQLIARGEAMIAQGKAMPAGTPFTGSSYDVGIWNPAATVAPVAPITPAAPAIQPVGTIGTWYNAATGQGYSGAKKVATDVAVPAALVQPTKTTTTPTYYVVKPGDTTSALANKWGTTVEEIMFANKGNPSVKTKDLIIAGGTMQIPGAVGGTTPTGEIPTTLPPTAAPTDKEVGFSLEAYKKLLADLGYKTYTPEELTAQYTNIMKPYTEAITASKTTAEAGAANVAAAYDHLASVIANRPSLVEQYQSMLAAAKVPEAQAELARLTARATQVEEQIESLPEDVKGRVQNFLMTQTQFERITKAEADPLTKLYNAIARASTAKGNEINAAKGEITTVLGLWEKDISRAEEAAKWGLEGAKSVADLENALAAKDIEYAKVASDIGAKAFETSQGQAGTTLGMYKDIAAIQESARPEAPQAPDTIGSASTGYYAWDSKTGTYKQVVAAAPSESGAGTFTDQEIRKLKQAGLSGAPYQTQLNYLYGKTILSQAQLNKLATAGVPADRAESIMTDLLNGYSVNDIKINFENQGISGIVVDNFVKEMKNMGLADLIAAQIMGGVNLGD